MCFAGHGSFVDENLVIQTVKSMAERGEFSVMNMFQSLPGPDGQYYSRYGIGFPWLLMPFYYLGDILYYCFPGANVFMGNTHFFALLWANILITTLAGWGMYRLCMQMGAAKGVSVFLSLGLIFATPYWPYAQTLFRLTASGAVLIFVFWMTEILQKSPSRRAWIALVFFCVLGVNLREDMAIALLAIGLYSLQQREGRWRRFGAFASGAIFGTAIWGWHNYVRFGSFFIENYEDLSFHYPLILSLPELVFGLRRGLVAYAPLCLLLPFSFFVARRKKKMDAWLLCAFILCAYFLLYGKSSMWHGGTCWGPRHMYFLLPFALLPGIWLLGEGRRGWSLFAAVAFIWGMVFNWPGVYAHQGFCQSFFTRPPFWEYFFKPVVHPIYITFEELDLWWIRMIKLNGTPWLVAFLILIGLTLFWGWKLWRSLKIESDEHPS